MNTITNLSNNRQVYNKNNQNVQFKGLNLRTLKTLTPAGKAIEKQIMEHHYHVAGMLGQKPKEIIAMTRGASGRKLHLLELLSEGHNSRNFKLPESQRENSQYVNNIYKMVAKPTENHFYAASKVQGSGEIIERIFIGAKNDPKRLAFVRDVNESIGNNTVKTKRPELIAELLESKNNETYVNDFPKYKSYLVLNKEDESAVKNLDKMVESGTFNPKKYDLELNNKKLFGTDFLSETPVLTKEALAQNYTKEGQEFLTTFAEDFGASKGSLMAGNDKDVLSMYSSTTKDNVGIRTMFIENFHNKKFNNMKIENKNEEISEMKQLFDTIDNNKHARKFVQRVLADKVNIPTVKEFNTILENVPAKKLNTFYSNVKNIIGQTKGEARISALQKEIENPFFETQFTKANRKQSEKYGYTKKESIFSKARKYVANKINIAKDRMAEKQAELPTPGVVERPVKPQNVQEPKAIMPEITSTKMAEAKAEKLTQPTLEPAIKSGKTQKLKQAPIKDAVQLVRTPSKAPNAKKLAVINDVNGIIEKKLGPKTLNEQKREYAIKATKMRMNMLPEIFASIKDTRAIDRAAGKKPSVSNKDALDLYERINGRNKKLVNYMLKKRNADGSRMFGVKDIISNLDKTEKEVIKAQKASPKTFKAADAKAIYNNTLSANVAQYGKLQRQKKS